ncbi:uncharacterized protein EAF02_000773 [Botrytis sinoallii]|uniref:uncharacterized protein n=1 Tax=Botrytis sinoallii TaxID=1463999 RepID=UPI0019015884|nr:uncharacterized protein EAF02_000773 [Botrytis sinoallii]KAF7893235.1 hypothetical protein EAF02_000773 [Botrytis sinoallii]
MPSANAERRRPEQKSSNGLDGEYARNQAGVLELDYGSPPRSAQFPNLSKGSDTEMEETRDDIDEAMRRRHVANEETDEIVEKLKNNVDAFKKKISALEDLLRDEKAKSEQEVKKLQTDMAEKTRENQTIQGFMQDLQRRLDEANRKLSVEVENGKNLQSKFTAEIAKTHLLREEKHTLGAELEDKKKLLDTLRGWFRTIKACANDETLDSYLA